MKYKVGDVVFAKVWISNAYNNAVSHPYDVKCLENRTGARSIAVEEKDIFPLSDMTAEEAWEEEKEIRIDDMIKYIADHYGIANQTMIAVEEMSELTKCICKCKRYPAMDKRVEQYIENIIEEIADVWIMMEQLKYLFGSAEVDKLIWSKLERQLKIIDAEME